MKKCPYCAEEIQDEAIKCRYCGSDLRIPPSDVGPQSLVVPVAPLGSQAPRSESGPLAAGTPEPQAGPVPGSQAGPAPGFQATPVPGSQAAPAGEPAVATPSEGGPQAEPTPGAWPSEPAPRVGEGAIAFSHSGYRYILGYGPDFFGIWDRQVPGGPVTRFPRTDVGWDQAWNAFVAWEPKSVEVPRTGMAPDARTPLPRFASASTRAKWTVALVGLASLLALVGAGLWAAHIGTLHRLQRGTVSSATAQSSENRAAGLESAVELTIVAAAIVWLMWQHRSQSNARALGAEGLHFSPGWAVGWWFIPFANIVMPYRAMAELWRASDPKAGAADWKSVAASWAFPVWWAAWLGRQILFSIGAGIGRNDNVSSLIARSWWYIGADLLVAVAGVLAISIIRGIDRRQSEKRERLREWSQGVAAVS